MMNAEPSVRKAHRAAVGTHGSAVGFHLIHNLGNPGAK
jgi:hypothetical protein